MKWWPYSEKWYPRFMVWPVLLSSNQYSLPTLPRPWRLPHSEWALAQCMTRLDIDKCPCTDLVLVVICEWRWKDQPITVFEYLGYKCFQSAKWHKKRSQARYKMTEQGCIIRQNVMCTCFWFFSTTKMAHAFLMFCWHSTPSREYIIVSMAIHFHPLGKSIECSLTFCGTAWIWDGRAFLVRNYTGLLRWWTQYGIKKIVINYINMQ